MGSSTSWFDRIRTMDPALLRGLLVAIAAVVAQVLNKTVITDDTINAIVDLFSAISALLAVLWVRPAVTPNAKVLVFRPNPIDSPGGIAPGEATSGPGEAEKVVLASQISPLDKAA